MRFFLIFLYCIHFNVCHANKAKLTDSQHTMFFRCPSFIFSLPTNLQTNALRIGKYCCCWWWWGLDNEGDIFICAFFCCCSWWRWMCHEPVRPLWFIEQYQSSSNINITTWSCVGWLTGWLDGWQKVKQPQPNPRSVFRSYSCVTNCICHIGFWLEHMGGLCSVFYYLLYIFFFGFISTLSWLNFNVMVDIWRLHKMSCKDDAGVCSFFFSDLKGFYVFK